MRAHLRATLPNCRVMEIDIEDVPWQDRPVAVVSGIETDELVPPAGIGWGADVNEAVIRADPPPRPVKKRL